MPLILIASVLCSLHVTDINCLCSLFSSGLIAMLTLIVNGPLTGPLVRYLGLDKARNSDLVDKVFAHQCVLTSGQSTVQILVKVGTQAVDRKMLIIPAQISNGKK